MQHLPVKRALVSVTDKSGLPELASFLKDGGVELVSTGGTKRAIEQAGIEVTSVSEVTDFPEILGGRVKTLHPRVHAGVLADKDDPAHMDQLYELNIQPFDMICVNLYDFEAAVGKGLNLKDAVEQIDIGGPTMLRAAAKNYHSILVVPDTSFYPEVTRELSGNNFTVGLELRRKMAIYTFETVSKYDAMIAGYLASRKS